MKAFRNFINNHINYSPIRNQKSRHIPKKMSYFLPILPIWQSPLESKFRVQSLFRLDWMKGRYRTYSSIICPSNWKAGTLQIPLIHKVPAAISRFELCPLRLGVLAYLHCVPGIEGTIILVWRIEDWGRIDQHLLARFLIGSDVSARF